MSFSAVVLAAGESLRMMGRHKMLLPAPIEPVVRRSTRRIVESGADEVVVVTGHQHDLVAKALQGLPVRIVYNQDYLQGQMTSVNKGLEALVKPCDAIMVCLADQVLLTSSDYAQLAQAYLHRPHGSILVPYFKGQRGNPIVFDSKHSAEIVQGRRKLGCRKLVQDNPDAVYVHEVGHDRYLSDLDTPEEYIRILDRLAESEHVTP
ncbi:nucleotidyltransferase family protein [Allopusillimonas ginsengisoli]|uniref:nucleotidyltransferase family protein n=1 Tax=Allopusillimonas ginsengisoli TaxID=453575 RepID=UPI0039C06EEF